MKKRDLEIQLQRIAPLSCPNVGLEQYSTPAVIAADVLFIAYANGDVAGRKVADLGCGSGMFSIGAWLLGAEVIGVDSSEAAIEETGRNAAELGADIELLHMDVGEFDLRVDTVIMNPPFGCQQRGADRPFLEKAMEIADVVYSMHMTSTVPFLREFVGRKGWKLVLQKEYKFEIPHMFEFHRKDKMFKEVSLICIRGSGESL
jgi:putative methylase